MKTATFVLFAITLLFAFVAAAPLSTNNAKQSWTEKRDTHRAKRLLEIREQRGSLTNAQRLSRGLAPTKPRNLWSATGRECNRDPLKADFPKLALKLVQVRAKSLPFVR
jgi:hypothetical protein